MASIHASVNPLPSPNAQTLQYFNGLGKKMIPALGDNLCSAGEGYLNGATHGGNKEKVERQSRQLQKNWSHVDPPFLRVVSVLSVRVKVLLHFVFVCRPMTVLHWRFPRLEEVIERRKGSRGGGKR